MRRTKPVVFIVVVLLCLVGKAPNTFAQVTIGSDIPTNTGSLLDLKERQPDSSNANSDRGLMLPRVSLDIADKMDPIVPEADASQKTAHIGLLVYHIGNINLCKGVYSWNGTKWERGPAPCVVNIVCNSAQVNGTFEVGKPLDLNNTITLKLDVPFAAEGGVYNISTNTQNGMSFSATGNLTIGSMNITLRGTGTPKSGGSVTTFTITATFSNALSSPATCSVNMSARTIPIARGGIFGFGAASGTYGYFLESSASRKFIQSTNNFGTDDDSKVSSSGVNLLTPMVVDGLTEANFLNSAQFKQDPDIMINGYYSHIPTANKTAVVDALAAYLERGGVLVLLDEQVNKDLNITVNLCKKLFPIQASGISFDRLGGPGSVYTMTSTMDDEIANGPFGDVRGTKWGEDASNTNGYLGLPADSIIVYSNGNYINPTGGISNNPTHVTIFKHKRLNLFVVGDGGFNSNPGTYIGNYNNRTICPFSIDSQGSPLDRTGWGNGGAYTVANGRIFANIMAWALKNARSNNKE